MIIGKCLYCLEQNLTEGEILTFLGADRTVKVKSVLQEIKKEAGQIGILTEPCVIYGVAGEEDERYVLMPETLAKVFGVEREDIEAVWQGLLEIVQLMYGVEEDRTDWYSILELYMDLGDLLERKKG